METFGAIAYDLGYLTLKQISQALSIQRGENYDGSSCHQIGELFVALGYLSVEQVEQVLERQRFLALPMAVRLQQAAEAFSP